MQQEDFTPWLIQMLQPYSSIFETMYSVGFKIFDTIILKQGEPKQWFYMDDKHCIKTHDDEWLKWRVFSIYCRAKNVNRLNEFIQSDNLDQVQLQNPCLCEESKTTCKCYIFHFEQKLQQGRIYRAVSLEVANELFKNPNEKSEIITNWTKIIGCGVTKSPKHIFQVTVLKDQIDNQPKFRVNRKRFAQIPLQKEEFSKQENIVKKPVQLKEEYDKSLAAQQNTKCEQFAFSLVRFLEGRLQRSIQLLQVEFFMTEGDLQIYLTGLDNIQFHSDGEPVEIATLYPVKQQVHNFDKCAGLYCHYATNNIFYDEFDEQFSLFIMAGEKETHKKITYKSIFLDMIERFKTIKMLEPYLNKPPTEQLIFKLRIYYSLGDITNNSFFKHLKISNFYKQETVCQFCFHVYNKIDSLRNQQLKNKRVILTPQQIEAEVSKFMSQNYIQKEAKIQMRFHSKFFDKLKQFDTDQLKFFQEFTLTSVQDDKYFLKRGKTTRSLQQHQQTGFQLPTIIKVQVNDKDNMIKKTKYLIPKEQAESLGLKHYLGHAKNLPFSDQGLAISKSSLELNKLQDKIREIQMIKERMDLEKIKRVREDIEVIMCTYYGKGKEEKDRLVDFVETLKKREQQLESLEETSQQIRSPAIQIVTDKNDFLSENQRKIKQDKEKKEQEILQTKKDFLEVNSDLAYSVFKRDYVSERNSEY
ncbi:unnamed protein product [Paramecium primaurelia]|uniref:Uncharacterized protein n=1 Tax=Paramecium primaurelia TaxID=5886 RepID=A0A8S1LG23_PARPR|nr:unnamed protein product [Paramecium primaurelia]